MIFFFFSFAEIAGNLLRPKGSAARLSQHDSLPSNTSISQGIKFHLVEIWTCQFAYTNPAVLEAEHA